MNKIKHIGRNTFTFDYYSHLIGIGFGAIFQLHNIHIEITLLWWTVGIGYYKNPKEEEE